MRRREWEDAISLEKEMASSACFFEKSKTVANAILKVNIHQKTLKVHLIRVSLKETLLINSAQDV